MLDQIKPVIAADPNDLTLGELLAVIDANSDLALIFHYGGQAVKPGYHVTEVKAGQFAALDCGAQPESWTEIFVQLWDVDEGGRSHMKASKFARIIRMVSEHIGLDGQVRLTFEASDGIAPIQLHRAALPVVDGAALHVALSPRAASCKPRDRWLKESGSAPSPSPCCD